MNHAWYSQERMNYKVFRVLLFIGATLFIYIRSGSALEGFYDNWSPISFFKLLDGPLSPQVLTGFKSGWLIFGILAGLNICFNWTSKLAFTFGTLFLGYEYNFGYVYHSTQVYLIAMFIMAFAPQDSNGKKFWHLSIVKLWVVFVMLITGLQKLYYGGGFKWAFSDSFYIKIFNLPYHTPFAQYVLDSPVIISQILAIFALVVVELAAPLSLKSKRWGILYFFIWTSFHPLVTLVFGRHFQFYSQVFVYSAFLPLGSIWLKITNSKPVA
jgi:hypothetical protein